MDQPEEEIGKIKSNDASGIFTISDLNTSPAKAAANQKLMNKKWTKVYLIPVIGEVVSTALLLLLGCTGCAPVSGLGTPSTAQAATVFGITVMFNIQIFGHISGAHMNPAVTVGAYLANQISAVLALLYVISQCVGALFGYWVVTQILPATSIFPPGSTNGLCTTALHSDLTLIQGVAVEFIMTAILIWVNCALCWDVANQHYKENVSIKFGIVVTGLSIIAGGLTGNSMNPARSLGPAIVNGNWSNHWVYWVGPLASSVICTLIYKHLFMTEKKEKLNKSELKPLDQKNNCQGV